MRCITYLKILCDCKEEYQLKFQTSIKESILIETMIETYQTTILQEDGTLSSKLLAIEFLNFLSSLMLDFNDIYFDMISGVRLDPLLQFVGESNKSDFNIVQAYAKFINATG